MSKILERFQRTLACNGISSLELFPLLQTKENEMKFYCQITANRTFLIVCYLFKILNTLHGKIEKYIPLVLSHLLVESVLLGFQIWWAIFIQLHGNDISEKIDFEKTLTRINGSSKRSISSKEFWFWYGFCSILVANVNLSGKTGS